MGHNVSHQLTEAERHGVLEAARGGCTGKARDRQVRPPPPQALADAGGSKGHDRRPRLTRRGVWPAFGPPDRNTTSRVEVAAREAEIARSADTSTNCNGSKVQASHQPAHPTTCSYSRPLGVI